MLSHLEESQEDVRGGGGKDDDGQERGHAGIGDGGPQVHQRPLGLLES